MLFQKHDFKNTQSLMLLKRCVESYGYQSSEDRELVTVKYNRYDLLW